jgi:S1-C subfamily serine protease
MSSNNGSNKLQDPVVSYEQTGPDRSADAAPDPTIEALDAYSRTVISVAEALSASVANLQVTRRTRRGPATGAGSGVVISPDGFLVTSAHVIEGSRRGLSPL